MSLNYYREVGGYTRLSTITEKWEKVTHVSQLLQRSVRSLHMSLNYYSEVGEGYTRLSTITEKWEKLTHVSQLLQ